MYKKAIVAGAVALVVLGALTMFKHSEYRITFKGQAETAWSAWKSQFNKTYGGPEEKVRFNIFKKNHKLVQLHNANPNKKYTVALNQFADLTNKEFATIYTGAKKPEGKTYCDAPEEMLSVRAAPDTLDWRTQGRVSPVKNQGQCGSCWSFSTTGALEGLAAAQTGTVPTLSEQELVDCSTYTGNQGCNGGWVQWAFQYVLDNGGIASEADYPYKAVDQTCKNSTKKAFTGLNGCVNVATQSADALKEALQNGPVSVYIEADQWSFQMYSSGVYDNSDCFADGQIDHAVLAVGYTKDAWIVKNSWGTSWGEKGYIQISSADTTDKNGICGILSTAYPRPL